MHFVFIEKAIPESMVELGGALEHMLKYVGQELVKRGHKVSLVVGKV